MKATRHRFPEQAGSPNVAGKIVVLVADVITQVLEKGLPGARQECGDLMQVGFLDNGEGVVECGSASRV